jgi:hypothetical protein
MSYRTCPAPTAAELASGGKAAYLNAKRSRVT